MRMQTPVVAILWENWRLTRAEAAWKLAVGIVGAAAVLAVSAAFAPNRAIRDVAATIALFVIVFPHFLGWLSMAKLNGGRPGFPFHLLYAQPVRTAMLVGVPLAYLTVVPAAVYFVSAVLLRTTSGYPFPLLPGAVWIAALSVSQAATTWFTRKRTVQMLTTMAASGVLAGLVGIRLTRGVDWPVSPSLWPTLLDVPPAGYTLAGVIALALFGLTVAAVERQRHDDERAPIPWSGVGFPAHLIGLFRFPCPTSTATRAQVWFELRTRGLPLLSIGLALASVNLLFSAVSGPIDAWLTAGYRPYIDCSDKGCFYARPLAILFALFSLAAVMGLGGNAFGILAKQGRLYVSSFEVTQPFGTGRLAVVKVLVRSVCVLTALAAVGASVWLPGALSAAGEIFGDPMRSVQGALEGAAGALAGHQQLALAVIVGLGVAMTVASRATLVALWTRYPRRLNIVGSLVLLHGVALVLLTLAGPRWNAALAAIVQGTSWIAASGIVCATGYLAWRTFVERLLTPYQASGIVLLSASFTAAWLTLLRGTGVALADMPAAGAAWMLSSALLPLVIYLLAPWSYSRVRHT